MIHSKIYKKYYPFKTNDEIHMMDEHDKKRLAGWIRQMPTEVKIRELEKARKGFSRILTIEFSYPNYCRDLANKVLTNQSLDIYDINAINTTLYRNKYNKLFSLFLFPIKTEHLKEN